ncbi:mucin-16-like [Cynocephalus volans]|uniref:mucin-16-like n=1 Tax=Cynocephalus volans TaxID=110931 RepID=UPI002FCA8ED5
MSTGNPEMTTALKIMSSKEPSTSPETRYAVGNSWDTAESTISTETTVEPVTFQSTAIGSDSTISPHLHTGVMSPAKSPPEGTAATENVSLFPSPSEAWTNPYSGTPEGTVQPLGTVSPVFLESTMSRATTKSGQQSSPDLTSKTTGMDFSTWLGSTGGTKGDTHVSLSTSSTSLGDSLSSPDSVTTQKVTMSSVTDKPELGTKTWVSTTVMPSSVLSKKTMAAELQTSRAMEEAYSSASTWSQQMAGSDLTFGASPEVTNTLHITSTAQSTSLVSLLSGGQAITSLADALGGKRSPSSSVTLPSMEPKTLVATTSVETRDTVSSPGELSQTSSPAGVSTMGVTTAPAPGITTTTMGTNSVLTTTPIPEGNESIMDSTLAMETSTSSPEHLPTWSSTAAPAPASGSWTITDTASALEVTGPPETISTMGTTPFLASSTESGSISAPHGLVTVIGTSLAIPSSYASSVETKASTSVKTLNPSDTTPSVSISASSGVQRMSTSVPYISSTSWTRSTTETESLPVSVVSTDHPSTKTDPNISLSSPLSDSLSPLDWATGRSLSPTTITTSAPHRSTSPQGLTSETMIIPATSELPSSIRDITSKVTSAAVVSSSGVTFSGRPDLTSKEAEQSSIKLPTMISAGPGHIHRPATTTVSTIPYTVQTPDPTLQGHGLRTPTAETTSPSDSISTSDSWSRKEESTSSSSLITEMINVSPVSGGTIQEVPDSSGVLSTTDVLGISLTSRTTVPPSWKNSPYERTTASEPTPDKEAIHPSTNTGTTVWATGSEHDPHSTVSAYSESSRATSPMVTAFTVAKATDFTSATNRPESKRPGTEPDSHLTTELRESTTNTDKSSTTETSMVSSSGSISTNKGYRTEVTSSGRISSPFLAQSTETADRSTATITMPSTFSAMTESVKMTVNTRMGPPRSTSLGALTWDTSAVSSWAGTPLAVTKGFSHSEKTTPFRKGPEDISWLSPPSVEETISSSFLAPTPATISSSHTLLTSQGHSPSSTLPVTSILRPETSGLVKNTDTVKRSLESETSLPPSLGSTLGETPPSYETSTDTQAIYPSTNTLLANGKTTTSTKKSHFSVLANSDPFKASSPIVTDSTIQATTISKSMTGSSETTRIERKPTYPLTPGQRETSNSQETISSTEITTVHSKVPSATTTGVSKKEVISTSTSFVSSPVESTGLPYISTEMITMLSASPVMTEPAEMTITTQTGPPVTTSQVLPDIFTETITALPASPIMTESSEMTITMKTGLPGATTQGTVTLDTSPTASRAGTDGIVERITKIPNEAARGGTAEPVKDPLASTSSASPGAATGPRAEASSDAPTTTISPSVPDMVTSQVTTSGTDTSTATPTMTLSPGEPETQASLVTHPRIQTSSAIPTLTVSSSVSGMTTSLVTSSEAETSTTTPSLTDQPHEPETTPSWVTHSWTEASSAVPTLTLSPHEPDTTASWVTHSSKTRTPVSRPIQNFTYSESDTIPSMATSPGAEASPAIPTTVSPKIPDMVTSQVTSSRKDISTTFPALIQSPHGPETTASMSSTATSPGAEASSAVLTTIISPGIPGMVTSQVTTSGTDTSTTKPTLTISPGETETAASLVTHPGTKISSAVPTPTVSPDVSRLITSLVTSSEAETSTTTPTLTDQPHEPETTPSWVTHSWTEASSVFPTLAVSPSKPETTASWVTQPADTSTMVSRTPSNLSHSESNTPSSVATSPGSEASSAVPTITISPGVPDMVTSQVTSSATDTSMATPTMTLSPAEEDTMASLVTHPGAQASSATATPTASPVVSGMVTSLVTSSEAETSTMLPTLTDYPHESETTAAWVTHSEQANSSAIPTITISPGVPDMVTFLVTSSGTTTFPIHTESPHEPETTASWVTHPAESRPTVFSIIPSFSHSESDTTPSTATSPGTEASSAVPPTMISPTGPGVVTSQITSSGTDSGISFPALTESPHEPETTVSWVTHPTDTSATVPRTTSTFFHNESDTTPSTATSSGAEVSSVVPTIMTSPGVPGVVTSQVTNSGEVTSTTVPTLSLSPGKPEATASLITHPEAQTSSNALPLTISSGESDTTASWVTHSGEISTPVSRTIPNVFHSKPETTPLMATRPGTEASSAVPTTTISPGAPDMVTSQATSSGEATSTTIPTLSLSPGEPESTTLLITHPSAKTSTQFPASTVFSHLSETTASLSITPGMGMNTTLPSQTVSFGSPETTSSPYTTPATETSRVDLGPTVSPGVPAETTSLSNHSGTQSSTITPASPVSPGLSETTDLLTTTSSAETSTGIPTLTVSLDVPGLTSAHVTTGEPNAVTSWSTKTSQPVTSAGPPESSRTVTGTTMTLIPSGTPTPPKTSHAEGASPTTILKSTTVETTNLTATDSSPTVAETTTTFNTLAGSPVAPLSTPGMSTLASESMTLGTSKDHFFIMPMLSSKLLPTFMNLPVLDISPELPLWMPFTVNFTITNLHYVEDMGQPGSEIFNATERTLQHLLEPLFQNSSVGSLYTSCRLTLLRAEKIGTSTSIDAVCTYHPGPTGHKLDRARLYWELSQQTHGVTQLGSYTLDRDSLYVNGYNHRFWIPTTNISPPLPLAAGVSPVLVSFTLNFTITNLLYTPDMERPGSLNFNSTEKALNYLLEPLFKKTSVSSGYSGCRLTLLRYEKDRAATGVDAICTYHADPRGPGPDRELLYQELNRLTHGVTWLGHYILDRDSLYVNGYNHRYWTPTTSTTSHTMVPFTLNFTITNLQYMPDMKHPGSAKFNITEQILQYNLGALFKNTSIVPLYSGCRLTSLRPERDESATKVDVICTFHSEPTSTELDRERLYWELTRETHGITRLGFFTLDEHSLYVNGYTHRTPTSTPSTAVPFLVHFTLNFTITNLQYEENMLRPGSWKFNFTERVLQGLLGPLIKKSSVGPLYSGSRLTLLRPEKDGAATGVDAVCTYRPDPVGPQLDRERLYWELSQLTHGATQLGSYTLDPDSLYVNGYTHQILVTTPRTAPHLQPCMNRDLHPEKAQAWELPSWYLESDGAPTLSTDLFFPSFYGGHSFCRDADLLQSHRISSPSPTAAPSPALVPFTLNFTITSMPYMEDMKPGSVKFNSTESTLQGLLKPLFIKSSIGSLYSGCRLTALRPENGGAATGVDSVCTHRPGPTVLGLDRERLYRELSQLTHGVTQLGSYTLDRDRLYVNGYTRPILTAIPSVSESGWASGAISGISKDGNELVKGNLGLIFKGQRLKGLAEKVHINDNNNKAMTAALTECSLNFTITNLRYREDMRHPGSWKFNTTERVLQGLLRPLFKNTSVSLLYSGCRLISLRPEKDGAATGVDAVCTYHPDPVGPQLDREQLYWELSQLTHGATQLGSYTLDPDSLYVNGYTHQTSVTAPSGSSLLPFTLNFTITNLRYREDMWPPGSWKFNITEKLLQRLLDPLFKNTSVGPLYSSCRLTLLRPGKDGTATSVDALCTYHPEPMSPGLDRERLYWELSQLTHRIIQLGPYTLDQGSLYISGYTYPPSSTTPNTTGPTLVPFTLNFTITNMHYMEDMGSPGSSKFNFTERVLQRQLGPLLTKTSVGPLYTGCRLASLRLEKGGGATGVDVVCTFHSDPAGPGLDRERLYWELSQLTHGITRLGSYTLDKDSLCVNGYTYEATAPTTTTGEPGEEPFTLNFTIDNLRFSADMGRPGSLKFNITDRVMQHLLSPLFQRSSLGPRYAGCRVTALRSVKNGAQTRVDILCTYRQPPSGLGLPAKQVFHELSWQTRGITQLGPYSLDKDSLYLNGYNERGPDEPPTTPEPATTFLPSLSVPVHPEATTAMGHILKTFTLNFTISNLQYSPDMGNGSDTFNSTERILQQLLGPLFQKSSLGTFYLGCRLISLRPEKDGAATGVDAVCTYHPDPMGPGLDRERLYWELSQLTHGITQLGFYALDRDSLFVNGYAPQNLSTQSEYQLNFRIINWNLNKPDPTSSEYTALLRDIQNKVTTLYTGSQLRDIFRSCLVTNVTLGSVLVTVKALFSSNLDPTLVKQVFLDMTLNASSHWLGATYQLTDLHVTEVETMFYQATEQPTISPSSQQFQLNFTITNLLYSQDLAQPGTAKHQRNKRSIENALNQLFRNSSIKSYFSDCQVLTFRSVLHSNHTRVDSLCNFSPLTRRLDRIAIYEEFLRMTQNGTQLQNFTLDRNSVLVDGYSPNRNDALIRNSELPFWAIILICLAGLLGLITCLICYFLVTMCLRRKEGHYEVQTHRLGYYLPHLDLRKLQ